VVRDERNGSIMSRPGNNNALKSGVWASNPLAILKCDKCVAKDICPRFQPGESCYFEKNTDLPDLETKEGIVECLRRKVEIEVIRYNRSIRYIAAQGRAADRDTTTLSNSLTKDIQILAEMSAKFGIIEVDQSNEEENGKTPPQLHVHAQNALIIQTKDEIAQCQLLKAQLESLTQEKPQPVAIPAKS
jgi:hypothetical protein